MLDQSSPDLAKAEHQIWLTAYLRALQLASPDDAEKIAHDAVHRYLTKRSTLHRQPHTSPSELLAVLAELDADLARQLPKR